MKNSKTSETLKQAQCIVINVQSSKFADVIVPVVQGAEEMQKIMKIKKQIEQHAGEMRKTKDQQELAKLSKALKQSKKQLKEALLESTVFLLVQCRNMKANNSKVSF
jgi:Xaa-Pro aminopeptidase